MSLMVGAQAGDAAMKKGNRTESREEGEEKERKGTNMGWSGSDAAQAPGASADKVAMSTTRLSHAAASPPTRRRPRSTSR